MLIRSSMVLLALAHVAAVPTARGEVKDSPPLMSRLKVQIEEGQTVPAKGGKVAVELSFFNTTNKEQKFTNAEYRFAILNNNGEQVEDALVVTVDQRDIVVKGRSTKDWPGVSVPEGKLKAGEEYYFVVTIRNLTGHVKFTANGRPSLAAYRAEQKDKKVTVFVKGENPSTGWKNQLEVLKNDIRPPEFKFTQVRPSGIVAQVITPFAVEKSADAATKIEFVFVSDAKGKHKVPVTQAK